MSLRVLTLSLMSAGAMALSTAALATVETGAPAPDFTAVDSNGQSHNLSDFLGKTVILEWTNKDCPYVKKHYASGNMQGLQKEATADDVVWLSVISSAPGKQGHLSGDKANMNVAETGAAPSAVLLDESGDIGRLYAAKTTPHMYVITPEGTLAYQGAIDSNRSADPATIQGATNYVTTSLAALEQGQMPDPGQTQPYGCSVKY